MTATYNKRKENKLSRLIGYREKKTKQRRRKTKKKTNHNYVKGTVVNISDVALSEDEKTLLSRGLSFCPRPSKIERFRLIDDIIDNTVLTWIRNGAINGGICGDSLKHSLQLAWA